MKKQFRVARPLWLAAASSFLSFAAPVRAQIPPFELQPVTVTGSGAPRTLGSEIAATSVLTRGDIERAGARDVVQVLNLLGTALVEQQGGSGTLASVRIRGAESRDTLVLIDGVPLTDLTSGQALLQQIPADLIERVEVVRGNLSALYGANASGGVIQVFTRRGTAGGWRAEAAVGAGSQRTRAASAGIGGGSETVTARLSLGRERTDGFSAGRTTNANPDRDGNRRDHAALAVDAQPAAGHRLGLDLRYVDGAAEYDAPRFGAPEDTHLQEMIQSGITLRGRHALHAHWTASWHVGRSTEKRTDTEVSAFGGVRPNTLRNEVAAVELEGRFAPGWRATAAVEQVEQSTSSVSHTRNRRDTDVLRVGLSHDAAWGTLQANLRHDDTSDFGAATTGRLGARVDLGGGFSVLGSASTSFTPPTFDFLFFDCGPNFVCSNPNLDAERARTLEAGLQWQDAKTLLRATVFGVRYRDKIANDANFVPQNLPHVKNQGLELSLRRAIDAWTVLAEASLQDPKQNDGQPLLRRTKQQLALRADYQQARWNAGAGLRRIGTRPDIGDTRLPAYTVVDASAQWAFAPDWTLSARIDNLFDRDVEPTVGYRGRPRSAFIALGWSPRR